MHRLSASIWTLLRYPHPPLNQSSYTIFSFHRLAGFLPHPASFFVCDSNQTNYLAPEDQPVKDFEPEPKPKNSRSRLTD